MPSTYGTELRLSSTFLRLGGTYLQNLARSRVRSDCRVFCPPSLPYPLLPAKRPANSSLAAERTDDGRNAPFDEVDWRNSAPKSEHLRARRTAPTVTPRQRRVDRICETYPTSFTVARSNMRQSENRKKRRETERRKCEIRSEFIGREVHDVTSSDVRPRRSKWRIPSDRERLGRGRWFEFSARHGLRMMTGLSHSGASYHVALRAPHPREGRSGSHQNVSVTSRPPALQRRLCKKSCSVLSTCAMQNTL